MFRSHKLNPLTFFVLFITAFIIIASRLSGPSRPRLAPDPSSEVSAYADIAVAHVYDGDTIKLANGERVRFVGIDTPESSGNKKAMRDAARSGRDVREILKMGHMAAAYTRSLLEGRRVRLEFDIERRDKYGRLLAYIYRVDDGLFVNEDIIKNGYAYPMTIPPNIRHADEFRKLFRQARQMHKGLWSQFSPDADKEAL